MGCCGGDMSGITGWFRRLGIYGYLLVGLLIVIAAYFIIVHQAHLAAYSSIIFLVIFIGLHLVMHVGGHGSHGEHDGGGGSGESNGGDHKKETGKEGNNGGSCH